MYGLIRTCMAFLVIATALFSTAVLCGGVIQPKAVRGTFVKNEWIPREGTVYYEIFYDKQRV